MQHTPTNGKKPFIEETLNFLGDDEPIMNRASAPTQPPAGIAKAVESRTSTVEFDEDFDDPFAPEDADTASQSDSIIPEHTVKPVPKQGDILEQEIRMSATKPSDKPKAGAKPVKNWKGLSIERRYTEPGQDIWATVEWELRTASIVGSDGSVVFEQKGVEIPISWSQLATNVVVSKYFRGHVGTLEREYSVKQLIGRVSDKILEWGRLGGYFETETDAEAFYDELRYILLHQMAAFNSPVWFNLGWPGRRQAVSACYINEVQDTMDSILDLYKTEGMLFKDGSGSGVNLSCLRASKEPLEAGGRSSGPVSFMKGLDASAGSIKSGGSTRRAACMRVLDVDHPDITDFINCKKDAELKAHALIEAGYSGAFNVVGGAYDTVPFQNANHSVRVTDEFMQAVENDASYMTRYRINGKPCESLKARDVMKLIAEGTWVCGDPGMQYDTIINDWHTCANTDRIYASNPCSEYMFLNSTACNLSSLNLMKYRHEDGSFDADSFEHAVRIMITAQEIVVGFAEYPTEKIASRSFEYRTLGLGYANLGALLMASGLPYDSDAGRAYAGAVTAIMTGRAYHQSSLIARDCGGPFAGYAANSRPMLRVIGKHRESVSKINKKLIPESLARAAQKSWDDALDEGEKHGYRNAQATVLAPTGTIGFLMDCDTTGIEPDIAIVKYKNLVGGGVMKIVNQTVPEALRRLGYNEPRVDSIIKFIDEHDTIEGASELETEHLPIFDCAFRASAGTRSIHYMGHIKMMAAAQPFISGAISKTVNVPQDCTAEEIGKTYLEAWKLGLKAVAIYRDGSKKTQPLNTSKEAPAAGKNTASASALAAVAADIPPKAVRRRLPDERASVTHKFSIAGHEGYITVGLYPDTGEPGEIFISMAKEGSSISGLMDSFATAISLALQYGVPLNTLVDKFIHSRFEPSGFTNNKEIPMAKSVMDYIFRWMALKFVAKDQRQNVGLIADMEPIADESAPAKPASNGTVPPEVKSEKTGKRTVTVMGETASSSLTEREHETFRSQSDAPPCPECGAITIRSGACYKCMQCGTSLGCS
jgi:ribonucleoside-diphosphate reductase alpha chain